MTTGITWPESLPRPLLRNISLKLVDNVVRSTTDAGTLKTRRRSTKIAWKISFTLLLTQTQTDTLYEFYNTTLKNGALPFDWYHPVNDNYVKCIFMTPPELSFTESPNYYEVAINLHMEQ